MSNGMKRLLTRAAALVLLLAVALPAPRARAAEGKKLIAITFDDGPSIHTPDLLDGLEQRGAVATFFMTGANGTNGVVKHSEVLSRMIALGCQLANHTYSHPAFRKLTPQKMVSEVETVEEYLYAAQGGSYLELVRIPGGANSDKIRKNVAHPIISWSVDPYDWRDRDAEVVYQRIMAGAKDGAIILLHDLYPTSIQAGLRAIDSLRAQGYEFVTVSELFRRRGVYLQNGTVYYSAPAGSGTDLPAYSAPKVCTAVDPESGKTLLYLSSPDRGITAIRYTLDGSVPTLASPLYTGAVAVEGTVTVHVAGFDRFATRTPVTVKTVSPGTAAPRIDEAVGGRLSLRCATPGARILYTTDGSDPRTGGTVYTAPFTPGVTTRAVAQSSGSFVSAETIITRTAGGFFYDVPADAAYYDAVGTVAARGLMSGTAAYTFSPDSPTTRAALVSILYRLEGSPAAAGVTPFADVKEGDWFAPAVAWAYENGVVTGKEADRFAPRDTLTRQQAAAIVYRYAQWAGRTGRAAGDLAAYADGDKVSSYAAEALAWCTSNDMLSPDEAGRLTPAAPALRSQCAVMIAALSALSVR